MLFMIIYMQAFYHKYIYYLGAFCKYKIRLTAPNLAYLLVKINVLPSVSYPDKKIPSLNKLEEKIRQKCP